MKYSLGPSSDIPAVGSKQYRIQPKDEALELFVVRRDNRFHAYENRCPHVGVNLNWQTDIFLNIDHTHIQCSTHGAQFRIDNGFCEWGPCRGQSLRQLVVKNVQGQLLLSLDN